MQTQPLTHQDEEGAGLVELLVAITIIIMITLATAAVMVRMIGFQESAESTDKAVQVARDYIERAKGVSFGNLGFLESDNGFVPYGPNGEETVVLPPSSAGGGLYPLETKSVGNTRYSVRIDITMIDPDDNHSPRRITVSVSWKDDRGEDKNTTISIVRAPTISEMIPKNFDLTEQPTETGAPGAPTYFEDNWAGAWSPLYNYSEYTVAVPNQGLSEVTNLQFTIQCPGEVPVIVDWSDPPDKMTAEVSSIHYYSLNYRRNDRPEELLCDIENATTDVIAINDHGMSPPLTLTYDNFQMVN